MSVINRMLADLDARRAPPAQAPVGLTVPPAPRGLATRRVQVMALAGAGLAAVLALGDWPAWLGREPHLPQPVQLAGGMPVERAAPMEPPRLLTTALTVPAAAGALPAAQGSARLGGLSYSLSRPAAAAPARPRVAALSRPRPVALPAAAPALPAQEPVPAPAAVSKQMVIPSAAQLAALAYRQAGELAATGLSSQAIDKALEALRSDPDHGVARQLAAVLLFEKNRHDEARQLLAEGLARPQPDPQLHYQLQYLMARLMVEAGDRAGALQLLDRMAAPGADAHGLRAGILAQLGRYREAQTSYEAAVRLDPDNAQWWLGLGVALDAQQQPADARRAFQRARALGSLRGDLLAYVDQKLAVR
jgi:MSHA biogenesis protein MshN